MKKIKIIYSNCEKCWYNNCIGNEYIVQSKSRKGGKGKYIVRIPKEDRHLMNGYMYGWIDIEHTTFVEYDDIKLGDKVKIIINDEIFGESFNDEIGTIIKIDEYAIPIEIWFEDVNRSLRFKRNEFIKMK